MPHFASSVRRQPLLLGLETPVVAAGRRLRLPNSAPPRGKISLLPRPDQPSQAPRWDPRGAATTEKKSDFSSAQGAQHCFRRPHQCVAAYSKMNSWIAHVQPTFCATYGAKSERTVWSTRVSAK